MLATADELIASMGLSRSSAVPSQVQGVALCDVWASFADRLIKKYVGGAVEETTATEYFPLISTRPSLSQGFVEDDMILAYEGSPQGARPIRQGRGNSRDTITLRNLPVRSISSVFENPAAWTDPTLPDGDWPSSTRLVSGTDWQVDWDGQDHLGDNWSRSGFLYRIGGVWSLQARTVKVTYAGGYTPDELSQNFPEFKAAALLTGAHLVGQARIAGMMAGGVRAGIVVGESMDDYSVKLAGPSQQLTNGVYDLPPSAKAMLRENINYAKFL